VSTGYELNGRVAQKRRTREALIEAARHLIAAGGVVPTVEAAAEAASISRTTAYRYFPRQRDLLLEAFPVIEIHSLLPQDASRDVRVRLERVLEGYLRIMLDNEQALRTALRLSLEDPKAAPPLLRRGRALPWIEEALAPARPKLGARNTERLAKAIRAAAGIESFVWLTDVAKLSRRDAVDLMKSSAHAILHAGLAGLSGPHRRTRAK